MLFRGVLELYSYFSSYFRRYVQYIHLYTFMCIDVIYIYIHMLYIYTVTCQTYTARTCSAAAEIMIFADMNGVLSKPKCLSRKQFLSIKFDTSPPRNSDVCVRIL